MDTIVVDGRLTSPTQIELAHPVAVSAGDIEVEIRPRAAARQASQATLLKRLMARPAGTRSPQEIDRQIREERSGWESQR